MLHDTTFSFPSSTPSNAQERHGSERAVDMKSFALHSRSSSWLIVAASEDPKGDRVERVRLAHPTTSLSYLSQIKNEKVSHNSPLSQGPQDVPPLPERDPRCAPGCSPWTWPLPSPSPHTCHLVLVAHAVPEV